MREPSGEMVLQLGSNSGFEYNNCRSGSSLHHRSQDTEESDTNAEDPRVSLNTQNDLMTHDHAPTGTVFGTYINILKNIVGYVVFVLLHSQLN